MGVRLIFAQNDFSKPLIINVLVVFWTPFSNRSKKLGKYCLARLRLRLWNRHLACHPKLDLFTPRFEF